MENDDDAMSTRKKGKAAAGAPSPVAEIAETAVSAPVEAATTSDTLVQDAEARYTPTPVAEAATEAGADPAREAFVLPEPPATPSLLATVAGPLAGGVAGAALMLALAVGGLVPGLGDSGQDMSPRLTALEQDIANASAIANSAADRLKSVEVTVKAAGDAADQAVAAAAEARSAVDEAVKSGGATAAPGAPALDATVTRLEQKITTLAGIQDSTVERLATIEKAVAAGPNDRTAAYVVVLGQIDDALRAGRPFNEALTAAGVIGGEAAELTSLQPLAGGAPTAAALARDLAALTPAITTALAPRPPELPADAGMLDRLWASVESSGTVTRVGDPSPGAAAEALAQASLALQQGDISAALAQVSTLPEAGRTVATPWLERAGGAVSARDLIRARIGATLQKLSR